jgi:DNA-binding transcriptional MerR regulator
MFKIGEISKITKVSVQMIRHYQKLNLIKPEYIDPKTGYRFFSEEAIYKIWNIKLMQMAGFSLRDIEINRNLSFKESINKIGEVKNELESKVIDYNKLIKYLDKQMINLNYMRDYSEKRGEIKYFKRRYGKKVDIDYSKKSHYELLELMMKDGIDIETKVKQKIPTEVF